MKRSFDLILASVALVLLSPLLTIIAFAVRIRMGRPILFRQKRAGLHGAPFLMLKFRTMGLPHDDRGRPVPDEQRTGRLGQFLRRTSLDELPELWNVVKGDMSLVGPRPLFYDYLPYYTPREARRHEVRPGITGLAQVSGRNTLAWDDRLELDVQYVDTRSLRGDLKILFVTVLKVLARRDVQVITGGHNRLDERRSTDIDSLGPP